MIDWEMFFACLIMSALIVYFWKYYDCSDD